MTEGEEKRTVEEASNLAPRLLYEVIRRAGEEEMERPNLSLVWSGLAAGVMISFSVLGEAILRHHTADVPAAYLIENLGYSLGFLLVILGRMQLFTENTITTVLPVMQDPRPIMFARLLKLWGIVLAANVVGALTAAMLFAHTAAIPPELVPVIAELSHHATGFPPGEAFFRAVPAGILVAAIVWMIPQAESAAFFVILLFTWLIAAGDFTHIVAGSVEMWFLLVTGELGVGTAVGQFFLPVLAGNIVGGTVIFAMMAWGQVKAEVEEKPPVPE